LAKIYSQKFVGTFFKVRGVEALVSQEQQCCHLVNRTDLIQSAACIIMICISNKS